MVFGISVSSPSKGIEIYTYIAHPDVDIEYNVPGASVRRSAQHEWTIDHLEVEKSHLHMTELEGEFSFRVTHQGREITRQTARVNAVTGNLAGGSMKHMDQQHSVLVEHLEGTDHGLTVTYTMYDAGQGTAGLPNKPQCSVAVSPRYADWLGQLAPPGSDAARKPFRRLVLPSAHDVGMNSGATSDELLQKSGQVFVNVLKFGNDSFAHVANQFSAGTIAMIAPNIISALAATQKDTLRDILAVGARYFEFRPARLFEDVRKAIEDTLYFQHGPISGMKLRDFLFDTVDFLAQYSTEIVVVQYRWDGVPAQCARPSGDELVGFANAALERAHGSIHVGNLDDLRNESIQSLRDAGKRLIILESVDSLSTYTDEANATLDGASIVREFENLNADRQNGKAFTNIQCQATASNIRDVVVCSALSSDVSNSPLLGTKARCDSKTLPWVREHALSHLTGDQLIVLMNDFIDAATVDVGVTLSRQRLN